MTLAENVKLVRIFATDDFGKYLFAKSLLEGEGIDFILKHEEERMAHGWSENRWTDVPLEPVEFWVRVSDANRAGSVLQALNPNDSGKC